MVTLTAVTVRPALVDPTPLVNTDLGINLAANFKNCDLAVPVCNNDPQYVTVTKSIVLHKTLVANPSKFNLPTIIVLAADLVAMSTIFGTTMW